MILLHMYWGKVLCKAELAPLRVSSAEPLVKKKDKTWISSLKLWKPGGHQLLILEPWSNFIMDGYDWGAY